MPDAIPSDHPTVDSHRVECTQVGRTGRPQLVLPTALPVEDGEVIRLLLDGKTLYAPVESTLGGEPALQGAYGNRRLARNREGTNRLRNWLGEHGYEPGSTLVLDVLTDGHAYGLREPGDRVTYRPTEPPDSSLADIADSLGDPDRS